jgi:hypothetical protein
MSCHEKNKRKTLESVLLKIGLEDYLKRVINESMLLSDFEKAWTNMLDTYKVTDKHKVINLSTDYYNFIYQAIDVLFFVVTLKSLCLKFLVLS